MSYWAGEWPNLGSISIAFGGTANHLNASELGILYCLVWHIAAASVHSQFNMPNEDPHFPDDDARICRIARCSRAEWKWAKREVLEFFTLRDGKWRLVDHDVIRLSKNVVRSALPTSIKASVLRRDGERCVYCGSDDGPFHYDHLWPVHRGGTDESNNVVIACSPCNLSKGGKTLLEWMASK